MALNARKEKYTQLAQEIREVLKSRQNIEIEGRSWDIVRALEDLIDYEGGKPVILPKHDEDYTIRIIDNITFPLGNKVNLEGPQRQMLAEYGWPPVSNLSHVSFLFAKLLKELYYERVIPVFLFQNSDMLPETSFRVLQLLSEMTVDRKKMGVPTILCKSEYFGQKENPLRHFSFHIDLDRLVNTVDVINAIEEVCPGQSSIFDENIIHWLTMEHYSASRIQAIARQLLEFANNLGLKEVNWELREQWKEENKKKYEHAAKTH